MIDPLLPLVVSTALALLFFMAARHKFSDIRRFQAQLSAYNVVPEPLLTLTARSLPWLEMAVALTLLLPFTRTASATVAAGILLVYAMAMACNLIRGRREIDCGCGDVPQKLSCFLVLRNAVLASACLLLVVPVTGRALTTVDLMLVAVMTVVLASTYYMMELLIKNYSLLANFGLGKQE